MIEVEKNKTKKKQKHKLKSDRWALHNSTTHAKNIVG